MEMRLNIQFWRVITASGFLGLFLFFPFFSTRENVEANEANDPNLVTYRLYADNFSYDQKEIKVRKGEKVRIIITNLAKFHDFSLPDFNVSTGNIGHDDNANIEFLADKTGEFQYYSNNYMDRQMGMWGNLIVQ